MEGEQPIVSWRPRVTADGSVTLVHAGHGEACHSDAGAWLEAWQRYVLAARVPERLAEGDRGPLRLLDVGTGLGWNIAALRVARDRLAPGRPLEVTTLELDRGVIEAALALTLSAGAAVGERSGALCPVHRALGSALEQGSADPVEMGELDTLCLLLGDGRLTLPALEQGRRFDFVFLDPFSPRVDPALWEPGFLREVAARMAPGSWLSTYSAATAVRASLYAAGLRVGPGPRVGRKAEGTVASPDRSPPPFEAKVARRIARRGEELRAARGG